MPAGASSDHRVADAHQGNTPSSFDRYADEFRAYWIQYKSMAGSKAGAERAKAIREQLVGTAGDPKSGYSNFHALLLRCRTWTQPVQAAGRRAQRPTGLQPDQLHSPAPAVAAADRALFRGPRRGRHGRHRPVHRRAAYRRTARGGALDAHPGARREDRRGGGDRIKTALNAPTVPEYTEKINPGHSAGIATMLKAIVSGSGDEMKKAYAALSIADKQALQWNAAFLAYVDSHLPDTAAQACMYAMISNFSVAQYDAMAAFISSLKSARPSRRCSD